MPGNESGGENKLVGRLYLDLTRLEADVKKTQELLQSIGTGIHFDLSEIATKEIRKMLGDLRAEVQKAAKDTATATSRMGASFSGAATEIKNQLTTTEKFDGERNLLTTIQKGFDQFGRAVTEVTDAEEGLQSITVKTDEAFQKQIKNANEMYRTQLNLLKQINKLKIQKLDVGAGTVEEKTIDKQIQFLRNQFNANNQHKFSKNTEINEEIIKYSNLVNLEKQRIELDKQYNREKVSRETGAQSDEAKYLEVQKIYNQLIEARKQYNIAVENGDKAQKELWDKIGQDSTNKLQSIGVTIDAEKIGDEYKNKIKELVNQVNNLFVNVDAGKVVSQVQSLENAYKQQDIAIKNGNQDGQVYWKQQADAAITEIQNIKETTKNLSEESAIRKQIESYIAKADNVQATYNARNAPEVTLLENTETAYKALTEAYLQYNLAKQRGYAEGEDYWRYQSTQAMAEIERTEETVSKLQIEESVRQQIINQIEKAKTAQSAYTENTDAQNIETAKAALSSLTDAYKQYNIATQSGDSASQEHWKEQAQQALGTISTLEQLVKNLGQETDAYKELNEIIQKARNAEAAQNAQENASVIGQKQEALNRLIKAYKQYDEAIQNGNQQTAAHFQEAIEKERGMLELTEEQINQLGLEGQAREKLLDIIRQAQNIASTREAANAPEATVLQRMEEAYKSLTGAYRQYNTAQKSGNKEQMAYWSQAAQGTLGTIDNIEKEIQSLNLEEGTRQKILTLIEQSRTAESAFQSSIDETRRKSSELHKTYQQIWRTLTSMMTVYATRFVKQFWDEAVEYASSYYDQLNEIRIVTMSSEEEADRMGQTYRKMAKEMSVSSTEVAKAAVEFWRQGLSESDVNDRLKNTTQYAKIAAMDFGEAAELVTAATNSMDLGAQRVVDVFAYLGDASASGADEIGIAMQRASASAQEAGLSFEWLGAYIATVSEQTRQAPETIGTAFNSMMSRLQSIKQKGFNEEDETKINDIAKALGSLEQPIEILSSQTGEWRDMSDIFMDIAMQWENMDDKARSYVATTIAGTRQKNVFLALMNDLSKVNSATGEASRAMELYMGALNSTGQAGEKYAVWQDSVAAAQGRMNASIEELINKLMNADVIKTFYNLIGGLADAATEGANAITILGGALGGLTAAMLVLNGLFKTQKAAGEVSTFIGFLTAPKVLLGLSAIVAGIGAAAAAVGAFKKATAGQSDEEYYSAVLGDVREDITSLNSLVEQYKKLAGVENRTNAQTKIMESTFEQMTKTNASLRKSLSESGVGWEDTTEVIKQATEALREHMDVAKKIAETELRRGLLEGDNSITEAVGTQNKNQSYGSFYKELQKEILEQQAQYGAGAIYDKDTAKTILSNAVNAAKDYYAYRYFEGKQVSPDEKMDFSRIIGEFFDQIDEQIKNNDNATITISDLLQFDTEVDPTAVRNAYQDLLDKTFGDVMQYDYDYSQLNAFSKDVARQSASAFLSGYSDEELLNPEQTTAIQNQMVDYVTGIFKDDKFADIVTKSAELDQILSGGPMDNERRESAQQTLEELNGLITAYNEAHGTSISLISDLAEVAEKTEEVMASLDTTDVYKDILLAKEEASGFASVIAKLGEGEDKFSNLHDAVLAVAQEYAAAFGITDNKEIGKIGQKILEGLYEAYPDIIHFVDTTSGELALGWEKGFAEATNPWKAFFDKKKLEEALTIAKQDMASVDMNDLWGELLSPDGQGLYVYAENWAKNLLPDTATEQEIHDAAEEFVSAFFDMYTEIDSKVMDSNGLIKEGMEGTVQTMREGANATSKEADKVSKAYATLFGDQINTRTAIDSINILKEAFSQGGLPQVVSVFEGLSDETISAITTNAGGLVEAIHNGTVELGDFDDAAQKLDKSLHKTGKDFWEDYLSGTYNVKNMADDWQENMGRIITVVSNAKDKEQALYDELTRLSHLGVDVSGLLSQFGGLVIALLSGTKNAAELRGELERIAQLTDLQNKLTTADQLMGAAKGIDPANSEYDPGSVLTSYEVLEAQFTELQGLQRGTAEYYETALRLARENSNAVYDEAAAWGVVSDQIARAAQAATQGELDRRFKDVDKDNYKGGIEYLIDSITNPKGGDVGASWQKAQDTQDKMGLLETMSEIFGNISALAVQSEEDVSGVVAKLADMYIQAQEFNLSDMADQIRDQREEGRAEDFDYTEQLGSLLDAYGEGNKEGVRKMIEVWSQLDEEIQSGIAESFPSLIVAMDDANKAAKKFGKGMDGLGDDAGGAQDEIEDLEDAMDGLGKELKSAQKTADAKYFKESAKAFEELRKGAVTTDEAFATFQKEAEKAIKAQEEFKEANASMAEGAQVASGDIENLAEFLGMANPADLLADWDNVGPMLSSALQEGEDAFKRLNDAAFIHITGSSDVDFSAVETGLMSTENLTDETLAKLEKLGEFEVVTLNTQQQGAYFDPIKRKWIKSTLNVGQQVLKFKGTNPFSTGTKNLNTGGTGTGKRTSGGGGGGSSSSEDTSTRDQMTEIEKMIDMMEQIQNIRKHQQDMIQETRKYFETTGELQGVIKFYKAEKSAIEENNNVLAENIRRIEALLPAKQAEAAAMSTSDERYEEVKGDLELLQKTHQEYTKQLLQNRTAIEEINQAIKEQQDAIRDMEIKLRDTIEQAIRDREELQERMLQGTIDVENEILDIIKRRYEKERDLAIETAEAKIDALEQEKDLLDEQLDARKKLADQEDKQAQLAKLQVQLQRISADPTRKKEELEIRKEIAELQDEMAWELAEDEVEAQKDAIDQQITSLDDYIEYVEQYYEDLFAHPQKLIEEMKQIIAQTDDEILAFLKQNSEDYEASTEATQQSMVNSWNEMLMDMHGAIKTYWDEVEDIIAGGDEAIIEFLKQNSADYKAAGSLQAQAYVDEWKKQLEDLRKAYKEVYEEAKSYDYSTVRPSEGSGSSSSSSSSHGGGGGSSSSKGSGGGTSSSGIIGGTGADKIAPENKENWGYRITQNGKPYGSPVNGFATREEAAAAAKEAVKSVPGGRYYTKKYAQGGLANYTGLAWLDGSVSKPERILSPYQTVLFEDLVASLHDIRTSAIQMPSSIGYDNADNSNSTYTFGDINVSVEQLADDADYEMVGQKIMEEIMDTITRSSPVGGIRYTR